MIGAMIRISAAFLVACAALVATPQIASAQQTEPGGATQSSPSVQPPAGRQLMDEATFRAKYTGKTMHLQRRDGSYFGSEQFFTGNQTSWAPNGDVCQAGVWKFTADKQICFTYDNGRSGPHCWWAYEEGDGVIVQSVDSGLQLEVFRVDNSGLCKPELVG